MTDPDGFDYEEDLFSRQYAEGYEEMQEYE